LQVNFDKICVMDIIRDESWQPRQTATEYWLKSFPTTEVEMNRPGSFANEGEILVTNGFNGCVALVVRAETSSGNIRGFLAHKHLDPKRIKEFVDDLGGGGMPPDTKLYGTVLYPGDQHGRSLSPEAEKLQQQLQQQLRDRFGQSWQQLRATRYAVYEGFPGSVNSNRLAYNVTANMWLHREGANDQEYPLSGLLKWDK
jgi:hypothetical protein